MNEKAEQRSAVHEFLRAFNLGDKVSIDDVCNALFDRKFPPDVNSAREYVHDFYRKCERRDPHSAKMTMKLFNSNFDDSSTAPLLAEFVVRCRQSHMFYEKGANTSMNSSILNRSMSSVSQASPFNRSEPARTKINTSLTSNDISRSRSNMTANPPSYAQHIGTEGSMISSNRKMPYRILSSPAGSSTNICTASNQLFGQNMITPKRGYSPMARGTASDKKPTSMVSLTSAVKNSPNSTIPIQARMGNAICETEEMVCQCLLSALLGVESRLFRTDGSYKMVVTSTASISTTHMSIVEQVLPMAGIFMGLRQNEPHSTSAGPMIEALFAAIQFILREYVADIDEMRRKKKSRFSKILFKIYEWRTRLMMVSKCYHLRKNSSIELLEHFYVIHQTQCIDENRKYVLDIVMEYTLQVFCKQILDWMTEGTVPDDEWLYKLEDSGTIRIRVVPIFLDSNDVQILMEIGKSMPKIGVTSDEEMAMIDHALHVVEKGLTPNLFMERGLASLLKILRDVVCGIVLKSVLEAGRLKDHLKNATSYFFLDDPSFTCNLYRIIRSYSGGLPILSSKLNRQQVSSAFGTALQWSNMNSFYGEKKLEFRIETYMASGGPSPNISSRMRFIQPLQPRYEPTMGVMKPIFGTCGDVYEAIFHMFWAIDLARLASIDSATVIPGMFRYLQLNYWIRENGWSVLTMLSNVFYVINGTLTRLRGVLNVQVKQEYERLLAAIDDKCVDVDDIVDEHLLFAKKVAKIVFVFDNDVMEQNISSLLKIVFEAQGVVDEFSQKWNEIVDECKNETNVLKAKMAELSKKFTVPIRILMEKINTVQQKVMDELDRKDFSETIVD